MPGYSLKSQLVPLVFAALPVVVLADQPDKARVGPLDTREPRQEVIERQEQAPGERPTPQPDSPPEERLDPAAPTPSESPSEPRPSPDRSS